MRQKFTIKCSHSGALTLEYYPETKGIGTESVFEIFWGNQTGILERSEAEALAKHILSSIETCHPTGKVSK